MDRAQPAPFIRPKVAMGVGGPFDFIAGNDARAPPWMRRQGWMAASLYLAALALRRMLRLTSALRDSR
jgi:UDP-N-acetyl-D-mannosaminuronic acid transferase (WecB/TagA/CpsF family)